MRIFDASNALLAHLRPMWVGLLDSSGEMASTLERFDKRKEAKLTVYAGKTALRVGFYDARGTPIFTSGLNSPAPYGHEVLITTDWTVDID